MSEDRDLDPIVAVGLGANKGFWMVQLRDRLGQWMKMGQKALMMARISFGLPPFPVRPTYVGPSQKIKGYGRYIVKGVKGANDAVYHLDPALLEAIQAEIPEADLRRQGLTPGPRLDSNGNPIQPKEFTEDEIIDLSQAYSEPITDEDLRLAKAIPTEEEQKIIDEERAKSPLAQLPPGAEAKMSKEQVTDLLEGKTTPSEALDTSKLPEIPSISELKGKKSSKLAEAFKKLFSGRGGKKAKKGNKPYLLAYGRNDRGFGDLSKNYDDYPSKRYDSYGIAEYVNEDGKIEKVFVRRDGVTGNYEVESNNASLTVKKNEDGSYSVTSVVAGTNSRREGEVEVAEKFDDLDSALKAADEAFNAATGLEDGFSVFGLLNEGSKALRKFNDNPRVKNKRDRIEFDRPADEAVEPEAPVDSADAAAEKAIKDAMDGKLVSLDEVLDDAKPSKGARKGAPLEDDDFIADEEEQPAPTPADEEPPVPGEETEEDVTPAVPAREQDVAPELPENEKSGDPESADRPDPMVPDEELTAEYLQEAFSLVGKMTDEELDSIAAGQDFTQDMGGFTPSVEQARALAAIAVADKDTVMEALAGAGKTSVLVGAAKAIGRLRPNDGVLVLCFGAKNAADAKARVPRGNTDAMTTHRLARRTALSKTQRSALKSKAAIISKDKDLAVFLGVDDTPGPDKGNIDPESGAMLVRKIITEYCNSDAPAVTDEHVLKAFCKFFGMPADEFGSGEGQYKIDPKWLKWSQEFWKDIESDKKPGYWDNTKKKVVGEKRIKIDHDHYLKLWQLGNPDLSKLTVRGKPVKVVLMDEAQDTNPTVAAVLKANKGRLQVSYVGDTNQNIFSFRGSKNALRDAKIDADAVIPLTMTYRFGDAITGPANGFLNLIGHDRRMIGTDAAGEIVDEDSLEFGPSRAHLVRSNYGGMKDIISFMAQGKKVGALSVFYNEIRSNYYYIKWLERDFSDPERKKGPRFPDGSPIGDCDFSRISNMGEWARVAKRDPKSVVARWKKSYDMGDFDELGNVVESIIVDRSDVGDVDSVLDGSIGATGKIWIAPDGKSLDYDVMDNGSLVISGDATLSYVNGEQLKNIIKARGYNWNDEERGHPVTGWVKLASSDDDRQKELDEIAALIPNRLNANEEIPDVIVSTAHRAKGLEWDNVSIGRDWADPDNPPPGVNPNDVLKEALNPETLRLAYVAASRARKKLSLGGLGWVRKYEGREGLTEANGVMKRPADFGTGAWDYREERKAEMEEKKAAKPRKIGAALESSDRKGRVRDEGPVTTLVQGISSSDDSKVPTNFLDGWVRTGAGDRKQYSKKIDGVRWELTQNSDGTVLLRNRSDSTVPSKKYDNMAAVESDFKKVRTEGVKNNRENAKNVINSLGIDPSGKLAKMIDNGATGDDIFDEIMKTQAMLNLIETNDVSLSRLVAAIDKLNNGRSLDSNNSQKLKKPRNPQPRKAPKVTRLPAGSNAPLYDDNPDRQDDGSDIGRAGITPKIRDQYVLAGDTEKPEEIVKALLELNSDAKIRPDGSIVWYRVSGHEAPETSKDFAGKKIDFELRIVPAQSGVMRIVAAYRDANAPKTMVQGENGEQFVADDENTKILYHFSPHKSLKSVLGVVDDPRAKTKSAGVERLLDMYFDRNYSKIPPSGKTLKQRQQYIRYYGGILGGIKKLRTGSLSSILNDKGADDTKFALRTPEEDAIIALHGRDERLNLSTAKDGKNFRRVMRKEVPSFFTALDNKNQLDAFHALLGYVSSLPDTNAAKDAARDMIRRSVNEKFPYLNKEELDHVLTRIDDVINRQILPTAGTKVIPHRYASGEIANVGDVVRWGNNRAEYAYGRVVGKLKAERDASGNYGYGNFVFVQFPGRDKPQKYSTFHLRKASKDQPLTSAEGVVKRAQLLVERSLEAGDIVNFDKGEILYKDTGEAIPNIGFDADFIDYDRIDFVKYGDRIIGGPTKSKIKKASDLVVGDTLYDQNTARLGTIESITPGRFKSTNQPAVRVKFTDGTTRNYLPDEDVIASSVPAPKKAAPLTALGQAASDLGLGVDPSTGKASRELSIHKSADLGEANTSSVKDSKLRAVKPTDEAREAKNAVTQIGSDIRSRVDEKMINLLKDRENLQVSSAADVNNIYDELVQVAKTDHQDAATASQNLSTVHTNGTKSFSTAASRTAAMAGLAKDGYTLPNGDVDQDKLSTALAAAKLGSLSNLVKRAKPTNNSLFAYAYSVLNDPGAASRVKTLQKAQELAHRKKTDSAKKRDSMGLVVGKAARDAYREVMAEEGVELDNVSMDEFDGRLFSLKKNLKIRATDTFKSKKALEEFFESVPSSVIRGLLANLKEEDKKLYIMSGVKRAYMTDEPDGYAIHLSNRRYTYDDNTTATDAAVHEVTHVLEHIIPNIKTLGHSWLYDRAAMFPGTDKETLPNYMHLPGQGMGKGERALAVPGLALGYMAKQYPEDKSHILNPNDGHFEVSTVLMQEIMSSFGVASRGKGLSVLTTDRDEFGNRVVLENVHFDPKTARYYTDSSMQTPIDNVVAAFGRSKDDPVDNDARDFMYGLLFSLAGRPPAGGGSSTLDVPPPSSAVQAILKKESAKPDMGFLASILSKFGGGTNLTREEYSDLLEYLSDEFGSESGYAASQVRAVKNYLAKILGL